VGFGLEVKYVGQLLGKNDMLGGAANTRLFFERVPAPAALFLEVKRVDIQMQFGCAS
jgi:hypothetical protein